MKKSVMAIIVCAAILISGCSSVENSGVSLALSNSGFNNAAAESAATASLTDEFEPPLLRMELNADDTISCLNLTTGSYQWDENGISSSSHADPISLADGTSDVTVVNTSMLAGNPRLLTNGGRIVSAMCRRDSTDFRPCEIVNDEIVLCNDSAYDIYSVMVDYGCGSCEYVFKTSCCEPPMLRLRIGNTYYALSRCNYEWEDQIQTGGDTANTIACGAAPWDCRGSCPVIDLKGETKAVLMLPDDAEIAGICVYSDEYTYENPQFNGRTFDLPSDPNNKLYNIDVVFPNGRCEYIFSTFVDGIPESIYSETKEIPSSEASETAPSEPAPYAQQTQPVQPNQTDPPTQSTSPEQSAQPTQPAQPEQPAQPIQPDYYTPTPYTWGGHHSGHHYGHHGRYQQHGCRNSISNCQYDGVCFYT